jgi:hypothetical protein
MDKKIAGLLGAAAALTTVTGAHASAPAQMTELTSATSYRDLLEPVPNAVAALKADNARLGEAPTAEGTQVAQYHHHHHHHHHLVPPPFRPIFRPHHHHHHHHRYRRYHR